MLCQSNSNKIILHILPVWFRFDIQPKLRLIWEQVSPLYPGAMFVTLQYQLQWTETWDLHRLSAKFSDISHSPRELPQEWVVWLPARILSLCLISSQDWQVLTGRRSIMRYPEILRLTLSTLTSRLGSSPAPASLISSPSHQHQHLQRYNSSPSSLSLCN